MVERIDPDYDPSESQVKDAIAILAAASTVKFPFFHYKNGNGNGFQKWILVVTASATVAGIGGGVFMYGKLERLEQQNADESRELADLKREVSDVKRLLLEYRPRSR